MISRVFRDARRLQMPVFSIVALLLFQLASTAMELAGLAALVPVVQFIQAGGDLVKLVADYRWWQYLVDVYAALGLTVSLGWLLATSMAALLLRQGFVFARLRYEAWLKEGVIARTRALGFAAYIRSEINYQDRYGAGQVVNDLTTELARAVHYIFSAITLIGVGVIFLSYLVVLVEISAQLTLIALAIFGVAVFAMRGQLHKTELVGREIVEANQNMSTFLVERLKHTRLIRLAGSEAAEIEQMATLTELQRNRMVRFFNLLANVEIIVEPIVIGAALVFIYIAVAVFKLQLEFIGLFLVLIVRLLPVLKEATRTRQSKRGTEASFHAVADRIAEMGDAREHGDGNEVFRGVHEAIAFEGVTFAYDDRSAAPALEDVSTGFEAGRLTALVGPSGAGKSTLFDMLPRLRRPQSGRIVIDGTDIKAFDLESLRTGIAYAPQEPQVFNVPLIEHIRYGKLTASLDEVRMAAELANAASFIEALPDGYATLAGDAGCHLSGGQRQRLDLARALVRRAPILLLDEPTSSLDADSEALLRDSLARICAETNTTVIVIAHRLSTVTMADKIVVMQNARIVGEGTHDQLMRAGGWYADAFAKQSRSRPNLNFAAQ